MPCVCLCMVGISMTFVYTFIYIRTAYELRLINKTIAATHNVHTNIEMSPVGRARGRE